MKILFATSEALPFAASGGLAEVAGSLPKALRKRVVGARIVLPLYEDIPDELRAQMQFVTSISVPVSWRRQYCGIFEAHRDGVVYYLLDNQYYFKRAGLYGHYDDAERFAFFSRAVLEMLPAINFKPDIIHANDWQSGLIPVYFSLFYAQNDWYQGIKTLYTIHNIQYQGKYGMEILEDVLGIPSSMRSIVEYDGCINLMKGAIEAANRVNTVSPTYAQEIMDPWYSYGLDSILRERSWKISGILNGIDTESYDPKTDDKIFVNYSVETHEEGKRQNKLKLQERLGLQNDPDAPLIGLVSRLVDQKGLDLVRAIADRLMSENNVQIVVLGTGGWVYEEFFREIQGKYPGRFCAYIGFVPELSRQIYAGSDLFLMPSKSEPCGLSQMIALRYGSIPIVRATGGLKDSVQDSGDGQGNGFVFQNYDAEDMYHAICRALEGFQLHENWQILVCRAMQCDNSWEHSANDYMKLYRSMTKE